MLENIMGNIQVSYDCDTDLTETMTQKTETAASNTFSDVLEMDHNYQMREASQVDIEAGGSDSEILSMTTGQVHEVRTKEKDKTKNTLTCPISCREIRLCSDAEGKMLRAACNKNANF
ncbi:unnamed protein product [Acanthoscelides obtectus]|uniref:Uncharacterized protein n=1 Tax=Acanthoscelides obtectus TaxID=200917 RepID=A0A9P0LQS2_ACAOB|nr:unnamed protein product [Acanthoscelides obtectus]CAK1655867.1 hypothetical protein AOBTE_LOCUS19401 [Acanthoscelides obtectus]